MIGLTGKVSWKDIEGGNGEEKEANVLEHLPSARHLKAIQLISLRILASRFYCSHFTDMKVKLRHVK